MIPIAYPDRWKVGKAGSKIVLTIRPQGRLNDSGILPVKLPLPRFSIRWLMVAVAVVGLIFGGEVCRRRQKLRVAWANLHMAKEIFYENKRLHSLSMQHYLKISSSIPNEFRTIRGRN